MLNVGLTGNVAAGKSSVLALFRTWGAFTVDADALARDAVRRGTPALEEILARFGRDLARPDGELDRAALRHRVMRESAAREALNAIVHPEVRRLEHAALEAAQARGVAIAVSDIPLLFEVADPSEWDAIVLVEATETTRKRRLMESKGFTREEADALIAAQLPSEQKRDKSNFIIVNEGTRAVLEERTRAVWEGLKRMAAAAGGGAPR